MAGLACGMHVPVLRWPGAHPKACTPPPGAALQSLADDCLLKLREYVASLGGTLDGEWKCRAQMRDAGSRAGSVDMWFKSPTGETYRSKVAVS